MSQDERQVGLPARDEPPEDPDREILARHLGDGQAEDLMLRAARALVREQGAGFGGMLRHLAGADTTPAIVHCSAGKDRTGWAASLLLLIAGVSEETVIAHYVESDHHRAEENARLLESVPEIMEPLAPYHADEVQAEAQRPAPPPPRARRAGSARSDASATRPP